LRGVGGNCCLRGGFEAARSGIQNGGKLAKFAFGGDFDRCDKLPAEIFNAVA